MSDPDVIETGGKQPPNPPPPPQALLQPPAPPIGSGEDQLLSAANEINYFLDCDWPKAEKVASRALGHAESDIMKLEAVATAARALLAAIDAESDKTWAALTAEQIAVSGMTREELRALDESVNPEVPALRAALALLRDSLAQNPHG